MPGWKRKRASNMISPDSHDRGSGNDRCEEQRPSQACPVHLARRHATQALLVATALAAIPAFAKPSSPEILGLPGPRKSGGTSLRDALAGRRSTREFSPRPLSTQVLSDLLWAANGVNRLGDGKTAPCWRHFDVIEIQVAMADGVWLYDPRRHALVQRLRDDARGATGIQDFVAAAPLDLVYVANGERMTGVPADERRLYASVDTGFIGQNVYLFCAAEGLACVFRGAIDYAKLATTLQLDAGQFVTFAQTVGYPKG